MQRGSNGNTPVAPAGAADGYGQVVFSFFNVVGEQEGDHLFQFLQKTAGLREFENVFRNGEIQTAQRPQRFHIERVWQKTGVEDQVRIQRDPVLETERHDGNVQSASFSFTCKE